MSVFCSTEVVTIYHLANFDYQRLRHVRCAGTRCYYSLAVFDQRQVMLLRNLPINVDDGARHALQQVRIHRGILGR
jgi:hypothetical protein